MSTPDYDELREDDRMVIDAPSRKVMVYPNPRGDIVLMIEEDGERIFTCIEPAEVDALCVALRRAYTEAKPISDTMVAEYGAFEIIARASRA